MKQIKNLINNQDKFGLISWFDQESERSGVPEAILKLRAALLGESVTDSSVPAWYQEFVAEDIRSKINNFLNINAIKIMSSQGLPPTTGYKINDQDSSLYDLNEDHSEVLRQFLPPDIKNIITINDYYSSQEKPLEKIEEDLGVPFFSNLIIIIKMRMRFLETTVMGTYLEEIIQGISSKTGVDISELISENLCQETLARLYEVGFEPLQVPVHAIDILSAMGLSQECIPDANRNIYITEEGNNQLLRIYNPLWGSTVLNEPQYPENIV